MRYKTPKSTMGGIASAVPFYRRSVLYKSAMRGLSRYGWATWVKGLSKRAEKRVRVVGYAAKTSNVVGVAPG